MEWPGVMWSSLEIAPGCNGYARHRFFGTQIGAFSAAQRRANTRVDTNMHEPSQMPHAMAVSKVVWEVWGDAADRAAVVQRGALVWVFLQAQFDVGVLGGSDELSSADKQNLRELTEADKLARFDVLGLTQGQFLYTDMPVLLPACTTFSLDLILDCTDTIKLHEPVFVRVTLIGTCTNARSIL